MRGVLLGLLVFAPALWASEEPGPQTPSEEYQALLKEYEAANTAWNKRNPKVSSADPLWAKHYVEWPAWTFAPRFLRFAEAHPKDPAAVDALLWVVQLRHTGKAADKDLFPSVMHALDILIRDHLQDERVIWAFMTRPSLNMEKYYQALLATSRDRELLGWACMALVTCNNERSRQAARLQRDPPEVRPESLAASFLKNRFDPEFVEYIRATDPLALSAQSEALLERAVDEFGDISLWPRWVRGRAVDRNHYADKTLGPYAKPKLEALRSLAVGKVAPEIEGEDTDGKPMKLSDYRGKVVVLVFWGTWCPPCMGLLPTEKALVERLEGRPFALLGINSDSDRQRVKSVVVEKGITWRSWWDGGSPDGPIATRWDVHAWPTIIVLDKAGVIRFKGLPHYVADPLNNAVDSLLEETRP